ncbi:MAG: hypothetical protein JNL98_29215 [Bryobacterales bacterium]|nr:hypothetical protein [Bryobacterales bacterium]
MSTLRSTQLVPVLIVALLLTGCDEKAIEFAQNSRLILTEYQSKLEAQIRETEAYYREYAALQSDSDRLRRSTNLANARKELTDRLSNDYLEKKKLPARIREDLRPFAEQSQRENLAWLQGDVDRTRVYLDRLETLRMERDRIEAFSKLLGTLSAKRTLRDEVQDIGRFAQAAKADFDKEVCADLKESAAKETDAARKKAIEKLRTDRKCK